ncbi:hypothetical protein [Photorhabdus sp. SF281]|uniref:hypothetical protein n=1 Tax=Photorhabdus sp. SF281 TaxID=3459527 RepID=UPI0040445C0F
MFVQGCDPLTIGFCQWQCYFNRLYYLTQESNKHSGGGLSHCAYDEINGPMVKTALHCTRLHVLDQKIFSVLKSYKANSQTVPALAEWEKSQTEIIEKIFRKFQFSGQKRITGKISI